MSILLYDLGIRLYFFVLKCASFFNPKARLWISGRKGLFKRLETGLSTKRKPAQKLVWLHCASLGEFEQGRPIVESIKSQYPSVFILLTFFSPSGYEIRKYYQFADWVEYLPLDTAKHANRFLELVRPDLVVFVKYEFWYHYLRSVSQRNIPLYLIAAVFRPNHPFFQPWGKLHRELLSFFDRIVVQDKKSQELLSSIQVVKVEVAGDPRVDRVLDIASRNQKVDIVENFCSEAPILICGSTWTKDEKNLAAILEDSKYENWKLVIAPHDISESRIKEIENRFSPFDLVRYSKASQQKHIDHNRILLIDNIGLLSSIYRYGTVAYVGGGFGTGIHNILEPMAHGLPVIFGPKYQKFNEAISAISSGCGYSISNKRELMAAFAHLNNPSQYTDARKQTFKLIEMNKGATQDIMSIIKKNLDENGEVTTLA